MLSIRITIFLFLTMSAQAAMLPPAPTSIYGESGEPNVGTYIGTIKNTNLSPLRSDWGSTFSRKRWHYIFIGTADIAISLAAVDVGYALNSFITINDLKTGTTICSLSATMPALPLFHSISVNGNPNEGTDVKSKIGDTTFTFTRGLSDSAYVLEIEGGELSGRVALISVPTSNALTIIGKDEKGRHQYSQKLMGLAVDGKSWVKYKDRRIQLTDATAGTDFTDSYLPRETKWKWLFLLGKQPDGTPVSANLSHFKGDGTANENALWVGRSLVGVPVTTFTLDLETGDGTAKSQNGEVDLTFKTVPALKHKEHMDLWLIRSSYTHFSGRIDGTIKLPGEISVELNGIPAVMEDQNIRW